MSQLAHLRGVMLRRAAEKEQIPFTRAERRFRLRVRGRIGLMEAKRYVALKVFAEDVLGGAAEFFGRAGFDYFGVGQAEGGGLVERARFRVFEPFFDVSFEKDAAFKTFFSFLLVQLFVVNLSVNTRVDSVPLQAVFKQPINRGQCHRDEPFFRLKAQSGWKAQRLGVEPDFARRRIERASSDFYFAVFIKPGCA